MSAPQISNVPSVIPQFLAVCPAFAVPWQAHLAYWDDQRGDYIDIAVLAHFIVESFAKKQTESLPVIFETAEELLRSGHPKQKEIITIGLIEDVQNLASHQSFGSDAFVQFLGHMSKQAWAEIARQWEGKPSLMDVVRSEKSAQPGGTGTPGAAPRRVGAEAMAKIMPHIEKALIVILTAEVAVPVSVVLLQPGFDKKNSLGLDFDFVVLMGWCFAALWVVGFTLCWFYRTRRRYFVGHILLSPLFAALLWSGYSLYLQ